MRTALLAGASGLVGGQLLQLLLGDPAYERVTALVRGGLPLVHRKLVQRVLDFERLGELDFPRVDDVFCCLGTTRRKAGSREAFRRVDFTFVRDLAQLASRAGARQFLLVTALGANPRSPVFYNRVKGEVEEAVRQLSFAGLHIFRPSLLVGERKESRIGERLAIAASGVLAFALRGPLRKYRPIGAPTVAAAMLRAAKEARRGVQVYESDGIATLAARP